MGKISQLRKRFTLFENLLDKIIDLQIIKEINNKSGFLMSVKKLFSQIKKDTEIWKSPIHGESHWQRVLENGTLICEADGGEIQIVSYFAIFTIAVV